VHKQTSKGGNGQEINGFGSSDFWLDMKATMDPLALGVYPHVEQTVFNGENGGVVWPPAPLKTEVNMNIQQLE